MTQYFNVFLICFMRKYDTLEEREGTSNDLLILLFYNVICRNMQGKITKIWPDIQA